MKSFSGLCSITAQANLRWLSTSQAMKKIQFIISYFSDQSNWERIKCKPISPYKLWKLQSESLDQYPRGMEDCVILQSRPTLVLGNHIFVNPSSHLSAPLPLGYWSDGLDWTFHNLHGDVGLQLDQLMRFKFLGGQVRCRKYMYVSLWKRWSMSRTHGKGGIEGMKVGFQRS